MIPSIVSSRLITVSVKPAAFCSAAKNSHPRERALMPSAQDGTASCRDLLSNVALAAHRIDGDDRPGQIARGPQIGDGDNPLTSRDLDLAEDQALTCREGRDNLWIAAGTATLVVMSGVTSCQSMRVPSALRSAPATQATKRDGMFA